MSLAASNNNPRDLLEPVIPIFPLTGALLLPHSQLPLNIFEPRYLAMVDAAMAGNGLIGMVQPKSPGQKPACYDIGCVGRISNYAETEDGRYVISLGGVCRFTTVQELSVTTLYRQVQADYSGFIDADCESMDDAFLADRSGLIEALDVYLTQRELGCDWDAVNAADDESLVNAISMIAPFDPAEKQALLEAEDLMKRAILLKSLLDFANASPDSGHSPH